MESLKKEYINLHQLLLPHAPLWQHEPISQLQSPIPCVSSEWIQHLDKLDQGELFHFYAKKFDLEKIPDEKLKTLLKDLEAMENIPAWKAKNQSQVKRLHLSQKKLHEIESLLPFLSQDSTAVNRPAMLIDIASGHGHLGRILADSEDFKNTPIYCLEKDEELILRGKEICTKEKKDNLHFYPADLDYQKLKFEFLPRLPFLQKENVNLFLGLHTCGNLALSQHLLAFAHSFEKPVSFVNVGCCYLKLHPALETNLSSLAQSFSMPWTPQALTLATRAHHRFDFTEYGKMLRVKHYRYGLQLFIHQELKINNLFPVGTSKHSLYQQPFSAYAGEKLQGLDFPVSAQELQSFYDCSKTQDKIRSLYLMTILRWRFGRCLEKILMLDRALWGHDNGLKTHLVTIFEEEISPRNIALSTF